MAEQPIKKTGRGGSRPGSGRRRTVGGDVILSTSVPRDFAEWVDECAGSAHMRRAEWLRWALETFRREEEHTSTVIRAVIRQYLKMIPLTQDGIDDLSLNALNQRYLANQLGVVNLESDEVDAMAVAAEREGVSISDLITRIVHERFDGETSN